MEIPTTIYFSITTTLKFKKFFRPKYLIMIFYLISNLVQNSKMSKIFAVTLYASVVLSKYVKREVSI